MLGVLVALCQLFNSIFSKGGPPLWAGVFVAHAWEQLLTMEVKARLGGVRPRLPTLGAADRALVAGRGLSYPSLSHCRDRPGMPANGFAQGHSLIWI